MLEIKETVRSALERIRRELEHAGWELSSRP